MKQRNPLNCIPAFKTNHQCLMWYCFYKPSQGTVLIVSGPKENAASVSEH